MYNKWLWTPATLEEKMTSKKRDLLLNSKKRQKTKIQTTAILSEAAFSMEQIKLL